MELNLPSKLRKALEKEAANANRSLHAHIVRTLERITPLTEYMDPQRLRDHFPALVAFIAQIPGVTVISHQVTGDAYWWVKLQVDLRHQIAWRVVQALGFVFNEISLTEKLPTVFKPTAPPPYLNGGPDQMLFWVVESTYNYIDPAHILAVLRERLPQPIEDLAVWEKYTSNDDETDDNDPTQPEEFHLPRSWRLIESHHHFRLNRLRFHRDPRNSQLSPLSPS